MDGALRPEGARPAPPLVDGQQAHMEAKEQQVARAFVERVSKPATAVSTSYDPVMKSVVITLTSNDTGEVVTQLPSKELLALAHRTQEFQASLMDRRA